ncbi:glycerol-3-phosphate ABC transporter substrate-binding protein [Ochrobactrum sp. P6BS-III]|uniref:extracellular solute-binding protein n=1 Tax=unclassified Ochrobactrum TaxID=239106 RepID=UPI0009933AC9|nr:sn-glycerol 3-phosphate transport system substrate-binding protein [Ochrobactrum sp. P6BSIII]OOL15745.1 glycerol-3-phosphate ABC transporter substrate-binding protein [Ochrobactrum sp. P6BS-III]
MKAIFASAMISAALISPQANAAEIEFWHGVTGVAETAIESACKAFNESQSNHHVKCVSQGEYTVASQKMIAAVRAKQHPVLLAFPDAGTLDLMLSGAVVPVVEAMPDVDWSNYLEGARSFYETSKGELYSQPYNSSTLILFGNKEMLAKAGIDTLPQTYEELAEDARKLKAVGIACPYVTDAHPWRVLEQVAARHGEPIASRANGYEGLDTEYVFNKGVIAKHIANIVEWQKEGILKLERDTRAGKFPDALNSGECAMTENSTGGYGASYTALGDKLIVGMVPVYDGYKRYNTLVGGASIWIMKGHNEAEITAAKKFLNFLRQPGQQIAFTRSTGYLPVTKDVQKIMQDAGMLNDAPFASSRVGTESLGMPQNDNSRGLRLGFSLQFRDIFKEELDKAFAGQQTAQATLDNAKLRGDALLRRFAQTYKNAKLP